MDRLQALKSVFISTTFKLDPSIVSNLRPGDVIFTRTNSVICSQVRSFLSMDYDHVAVVVSASEVVHVSPPKASKVSIQQLTNDKATMILRPKLEEMEKFVGVMLNFIGEKYQLMAIPKILIRELEKKLKMPENIQFSLANLKYSRICTDAVLYALSRGSPSLTKNINNYIQDTNFRHIGYVLPQELAAILRLNGAEMIYEHPIEVPSKSILPFERIYEKTKQMYFDANEKLCGARKNFPKMLGSVILRFPKIFSQIMSLVEVLSIIEKLGVSLPKAKLLSLAVLLLLVLPDGDGLNPKNLILGL